MPSFSISLSGLLANEEDLSVISNNLANLNTTGYKGETAQFQDLFYQALGTDGAGDPIQIGVGTRIGSTAGNFSQGSVQSTGLATDVAVQGDGFFQVQSGGLTLYTRNGNLSIDANGYLVTSDGAQVMGLQAVNGVVSASSVLGALKINSGQTVPPKPTANMQMVANLNAAANVGDTFSAPLSVIDSLGVSHVLTYNFAKTAANTWSYQITIPAADVGGTGSPVAVNSGSLTFDGSGNLTSPKADVTGIAVSSLADGASPLNLTWTLFDSSGASLVTQVGGASASTSTKQDGTPSGSLIGFNIGNDGTIQGNFSNGQSVNLGQIQLAIFPNSEGLLRTGSNNFLASLASGLPSVGGPGTGGRGTLSAGALENSNVDIATQFAQLILAERGFQANSRAITTADNILQEAVNLIR